MTTEAVAVAETASYKRLIEIMRQERISSVPVVDAAGHVSGVVSEADLLLKEVGLDALTGLWATGRRGELAKAAGLTAADLMTQPALTIGPEESVGEAARRMHDYRVKHLPVVGHDGELVGIVSRIDLLSVFDRPDQDIRSEITEEILAGRLGLDRQAFSVTVTSGIVTIGGRAPSEAVAAELIDAICQTEGVVNVRDKITWPSADTG
ncbi:MAG TPA: CBS domain-containing protein [Streptosporangiaceae bacterium]|nr:CBS domain-containing protein [Streptosporangiaceae bacterium]